MPTIIADNAGYDSAELIANLRAAHVSGKSTFGLGISVEGFLSSRDVFLFYLDMENGRVTDMAELGILESFHLKRQVVISAAEAAEMVLRIDNIIRAPPRPRQRDMRHH